MSTSPNRVAVITGASSGIGHLTAKRLAAKGWDIIGQGRDPDRCNSALTDIKRSAAPGSRVAMLQCDLTLLSDTAELAEKISSLTEHVDVLMNNAGGVRREMSISREGNEATFVGNYLGHFLLTKLMMRHLRCAAQIREAGTVRIINTSSLGHELCSGIDWSDLQRIQNWNSGQNYCLAKLCVLLFTFRLSQHIQPEGIVAHAMHPGVVNSNFHAHATLEMQSHMLARPGDPPSKSAETLAWLVTDTDVGAITGGYYHDMALVTPSSLARDPELAARLWTESEALLARSGF